MSALDRFRGWTGRRRRAVVIVLAAALCATGVGIAYAGGGAGDRNRLYDGLFAESVTPKVVTDPDTAAVELGVQFTSAVPAKASGVQFYRGPENVGPHRGTLWDAGGHALATVDFPASARVGWQTAVFDQLVPLTPGQRYVVSYTAPAGKYSADEHGFDKALRRGALRAPAGAGVFADRPGAFPDRTFRSSNYYVDIVLSGQAVPTAAAEPSAAATGTSSPMSPATPSATPSSSAAATPTATGSASPSSTPRARSTAAPTSATPRVSGTSVPGTSVPPVTAGAPLSLPRIPWEGGPAYWKRFSKASAAGWSDPSFFPVVVWYNGINSDSEVAYDKSLGINTYVGMSDTTPYSLFGDNGVFWIGDKLNDTFTSSSTNWVGYFLDDEVDGRYTPSAGQAYLQSLVDALPADGRFAYANFTQSVTATDMSDADANAYVNNYTNVVSVDMYWYTIPFCDWSPYRGDVYLSPVLQSNCRTASSYGRTVESLRQRDQADGKLQPIWQFVEDFNGGPGASAPAVYITPTQLEGAAMNSVIHEARGLVYFNQSLSGSCQGGSLVRETQIDPGFCAAPQIAAMGEVNNRIHALAPIINTQSYAYTFGPGLDTMLKADGSSVYVFAMVDGASKPGARTFHLPAEVKGRSVQVLFENRTIPASTDGTFVDTFASESTYHIYRVTR